MTLFHVEHLRGTALESFWNVRASDQYLGANRPQLADNGRLMRFVEFRGQVI